MLGFKLPENDSKYEWTNHVKEKMVYYGISASLIKRVVRFPKRKEEGIALGTIAVMQPTSSKKQEIWVMYQEASNKQQATRNKQGKLGRKRIKNDLSLGRLSLATPRLHIISAWRYPGISPVGKPIPIPEEILSAVAEALADSASDF